MKNIFELIELSAHQTLKSKLVKHEQLSSCVRGHIIEARSVTLVN